MGTRIAITGTWLAAALALIRFWDLTVRVEGFLVWTALFLSLYALEIVLLNSRNLLESDRSWAPVLLWIGIVFVTAVGGTVFPQVSFGDTTLQTVALFRVFDIVLPLWILLRGVFLAIPGRGALLATMGVPVYLLAVLWVLAVRMPGESYRGPLDPFSPEEVDIMRHLEKHVRTLADSIGPRGALQYQSVQGTVEYLHGVLRDLGYSVEVSTYQVRDREHRNLQASIQGSPSSSEIVVVGAHYDTYFDTPGADDNASGVAGVLELARLLADFEPERTIRFVLFGTEEPPYFNTDDMGSRVYAKRVAQAGDDIVAMFSLDPIGCYADDPGTQNNPPPLNLFYPDRGDFIAFVGNPASGSLVRRSLETFRRTTRFPSEGIVSPSMLPGIELSDHASFWRSGFRAVLVSTTGPFRNPFYHTPEDTPSGVDFRRTARVVSGLREVLIDLAGPLGGR
ncbi:M28 family peptidase [Gemmatimonadota bacterium]